MFKAPLPLIGVLLALALVGTIWVGGSAAHFPLTTVDFDRGRQLFQQRCATCHSVDPQALGSAGPSLARIGEVAAHRAPGMPAEQFILESILQPNSFRTAGEQAVMPANISAGLDRDDVLSIVGYLMTLGGTPDHQRLLALPVDIPAHDTEDVRDLNLARVEAGRRVYLEKGQCATCHPLQELPGFDLRGPNLLTAGLHDETYLREAILDASRTHTSGYELWNVLLADGRVVNGRLVQRSEESLTLLTESSAGLKLQAIALDDVARDADDEPVVVASSTSAMPDRYQDVLSDEEIDSLVAFLKTLD
ncbi:MAG: hypothetical protein DWQ34_21390 [Planctomycetota bacterium]|nr:MAG: hypothetical protein DWQ34_21390 [Planctomycetota bacterium]REK29476.1 MAG: hypothetical protein DWQ41_04165 [Planctomycetota bacterium]REK31841.1 MAG: hypothetical protein DWQ45_18415 [Planctomycetota bacterium]